jgi:hypothetical protein
VLGSRVDGSIGWAAMIGASRSSEASRMRPPPSCLAPLLRRYPAGHVTIVTFFWTLKVTPKCRSSIHIAPTASIGTSATEPGRAYVLGAAVAPGLGAEPYSANDTGECANAAAEAAQA